MAWPTTDELIRLLGILAWPVTVLLVAFMFRREMRGLFSRLKTLRARGIEAEFEKLPRAAMDSEPKAAREELQSVYHRLSTLSPEATVMESWRQLEEVLNRKVSGVHPPSVKFEALGNRYREFADFGPLLSELRTLRNAVAHARNERLTPGQALRYAENALSLAAKIAQVEPIEGPRLKG